MSARPDGCFCAARTKLGSSPALATEERSRADSARDSTSLRFKPGMRISSSDCRAERMLHHLGSKERISDHALSPWAASIRVQVSGETQHVRQAQGRPILARPKTEMLHISIVPSKVLAIRKPPRNRMAQPKGALSRYGARGAKNHKADPGLN